MVQHWPPLEIVSYDIEVIMRQEGGWLSIPRDLPDDLDRLQLASPKIVIGTGDDLLPIK